MPSIHRVIANVDRFREGEIVLLGPAIGNGTGFAIEISDVTVYYLIANTMKKRSEARVLKSLLVDISRKGLQQMGVTVNISRRGMCIATTEVLRKRSKLRILVAAADDIYALTGTVVWHVKKEGLASEDVPAGIGISIERAVPEYYKYIAAVEKHPFFLPKGKRAC